MRKIITALAVPFVLFLGVAAGNLESWQYPQLWIIYAIVFVAAIWQPTYKPIDPDIPAHDRGTSTQIVWSVYTAMIVSVVEAVYFRFPESWAWGPHTTVGLILALVGLGLRTWAFRTLGRHFTWHITVFDDHKVVTDGPYRLVRHPGYTGAWILYSAIPLMLGAWIGVVIAIVLQFFAYQRRIKYEEAAMSSELGSAYADYARTVKRLVPFIY